MSADRRTQITLTNAEPWEQQPRESDVQYLRYTAYQNAGRARNVRLLADDLGKSVTYLRQVAWKYRWHERACAWDGEQDRLFIEQLAEERRRMVDDHLRLSRGMLMKVAQRLKTMDAEELTPADIQRWAATLTTIQRQVLGEPTHTVAVQGGAPGSPPVQLAASANEVVQRERFDELRTRLLGALSADSIDDIDPADLDEDELAAIDEGRTGAGEGR